MVVNLAHFLLVCEMLLNGCFIMKPSIRQRTYMHKSKRKRGIRVLHVVRDHEGDGGRDPEVGQEDEEEGRVDGDRNGELEKETNNLTSYK